MEETNAILSWVCQELLHWGLWELKVVARELSWLWRWEVRGVLGSLSPGDCQGSCQLKGTFGRGLKQVFQRFSPADHLHYAKWADSQLTLSKHQGGFFEKQKPCSASNQHFHGILFIVLISVQHCRLGAFSLPICYFDITLAWPPPSLVPHSLNHVFCTLQ